MSSIVYFEIDDTLYGFQAAELTGVGSHCPVTSYPGLSQGIAAVVLWGGASIACARLLQRGVGEP